MLHKMTLLIYKEVRKFTELTKLIQLISLSSRRTHSQNIFMLFLHLKLRPKLFLLILVQAMHCKKWKLRLTSSIQRLFVQSSRTPNQLEKLLEALLLCCWQFIVFIVLFYVNELITSYVLYLLPTVSFMSTKTPSDIYPIFWHMESFVLK